MKCSFPWLAVTIVLCVAAAHSARAAIEYADITGGRVRGEDGKPIAGLYAAGRSAVGICSRSYVSGLSLADCVFSGRRAGLNSALAHGVLDKNKNVF